MQAREDELCRHVGTHLRRVRVNLGFLIHAIVSKGCKSAVGKVGIR